MYAACTGPPTVDHVTQVEVRVEVVLVWAPVVVEVYAPQADATARSVSDRAKLWPTKHPRSLPIMLLWPAASAPDTEGCGVADHSTRLLLGTASNVLFVRAMQCWLQRLHWARLQLGHPRARSLRASGLHLSQQTDVRSRQSGVPQPL